jgi:hypothetical protein
MQSDGCTGWLDGWPQWLGGTGEEWRHCCVAHDERYAAGEGFWRLFVSHFELGACVWTVSPLMAVLMVGGLLTFGAAYFVNAKNRFGRPGRD